MVKLRKVCPSCGKSEGAAEFAGAFCAACFSQRSRAYALPKNLEVRLCQRCNRFLVKGEWVGFDEGVLREWIVGKIKSSLQLSSCEVGLQKMKTGYNADLRMAFAAEGGRIEKSASAFVAVNKGLCDSCMKRSGGYHEAVVQLRGGTASQLHKLAEELVRACERSSFVSGFEEKKEGIDFLVGDKPAALAAVSRLGMPYSLAHKLIGVKEGKRVFRVTICIRL